MCKSDPSDLPGKDVAIYPFSTRSCGTCIEISCVTHFFWSDFFSYQPVTLPHQCHLGSILSRQRRPLAQRSQARWPCGVVKKSALALLTRAREDGEEMKWLETIIREPERGSLWETVVLRPMHTKANTEYVLGGGHVAVGVNARCEKGGGRG